MQITVTISRQEQEEPDILSLEVYPEMTVETLQSSIQAETTLPPSQQHLYHDGNLISDKTQTLQALNVTNGDMIALRILAPRSSAQTTRQPQQQRAAQPGAAGGQRQMSRSDLPDPEVIRLQILGDPRLREEAIRQQPQLAAVIDDPARFAQFFSGNDRERRERAARQTQITQLNSDPFDIEAQMRIEELIRQEQVMENLQNAMEHNPEVFGRVHMLYVDVEVNGHKVKALVDSGAQATIMSPSCAEACNIMRLVDKRFAGVARGVGTANIIGRVHAAQIKIGSLFLPCSFTVMEGKSVELLIGLDMLKRYQATLDLAKDRLIIQGVEIPFLGEADIPKDSEEALAQEPTIEGPNGTTVGQRSGVVSGPGGEESTPEPSAQPAAQAAPAAAPAPAPAAAPAAAPSPAAAPQPQQAAGVTAASEADIQQLVALGFPRDRSVQALEATGGNVEFAANLLFQSS